MARPENTGLQFALDSILSVKKEGNHVTAMLSVADLVQLGGVTAVEYCGGPAINFAIGRVDCDESGIPGTGLFQEPTEAWSGMAAKYHRQGFTDREIVALNGCHTIGFAHEDRSGIKGRWTMNPYVFDNTYYKEVLNPNSKYLKTNMELGMLGDPAMKEQMEEYAQDQNKWFTDYAAVHKKMSELGCKNLHHEIP